MHDMRDHVEVPGEAKTILAHEPVEGYRSAFYVCFVLATLYLAMILAGTV